MSATSPSTVNTIQKIFRSTDSFYAAQFSKKTPAEQSEQTSTEADRGSKHEQHEVRWGEQTGRDTSFTRADSFRQLSATLVAEVGPPVLPSAAEAGILTFLSIGTSETRALPSCG